MSALRNAPTQARRCAGPTACAGPRASRRASLFAAVLLGLGGLAVAGELDPALAALAQVSPRTASAVLIELDGARPIEHYAAQVAALPRATRPGHLAALMRSDFEAAAAALWAPLRAAGGWGAKPLWISHAIAVHVARGRLAELAALPGVKRIEPDVGLRSVTLNAPPRLPGAGARHAASAWPAAVASLAQASTPGAASLPAPALPASLEALASGQVLSVPPHLLALDVLDAWQRGHAGAGVTVAIVDGGVDPGTPAIAQAYRGRATDWFDPYAQQSRPVDATGHGTWVAGLLVGTLIDATPIGVAPQARWIAARLFDDAGQGRASAVHRIYQWALDPDGNADTPDAPDIVNNSWGLAQSAGRCNTSFARALAALRAADIHVVFAAGNDGPAPGTSMSPANNPGVLSVGALTAERQIAPRSSRGPSGCGGAVFPSLHAPGVNLPALDRIALATGSAALADGTSFAAAAVSGALAVLRGAAPDAGLAEIEARLSNSIQPTGTLDAAQALRVPSLKAALDALPVPDRAAPALQRTPRLRWTESLEPAGALEVSAEALRDKLPWSFGVRSIELEAEPASGVLDALASGSLPGAPMRWRYRPDAQAPAPLRLRVTAHDGRATQIELVPLPTQTPAALQRPRQAVQTGVNQSVQVTLTGTARTANAAVNTDDLRLTTPLRGGKVKRLGDDRVEYTPPQDFVGSDQFTYAPRSGPDATVVHTVVVRVVRP